jgi:hypothetical protein
MLFMPHSRNGKGLLRDNLVLPPQPELPYTIFNGTDDKIRRAAVRGGGDDQWVTKNGS